MPNRLTIVPRFLLASGVLGGLSIYVATSLSFTFWLLFLTLFTFSILLFTRLKEMWTVIPTFVAGKVWIYALGASFKGYGVLILSLSFFFLFVAELKRVNISKSKVQENRA